MADLLGRIPAGPAERFDTTQDLMCWMGANFERFGPIYKASAFGCDIYATTDPEHVQHVLRKNWQNYKKGFAIKRIGLLLGSGLMVSEGGLWKSQRKMVQPSLHRDMLNAVSSLATSINQELCDDWERAARNGETINVTRDTSLTALEVMLRSIFGNDYPQLATSFRILSDEAARDLEFAESFRLLRREVAAVAARRRASNASSCDILGLLMQAEDANGELMPDKQLVSEVMTLVVAGHETTAATLNWTWYLLSRNLEAEQKLHNEVDQLDDSPQAQLGDLRKSAYTRQVIEEAMRLYPAGWLLTRKALKDDRLGEYFVPAGTEIYISPYFIQRSSTLWQDPERFDPERFAPSAGAGRPELAMLAFSAGPRNCAGELFARIEMQIHLTMVARRLRLRYMADAPPQLDAGVNLRSKHDLIMKPEIRV